MAVGIDQYWLEKVFERAGCTPQLIYTTALIGAPDEWLKKNNLKIQNEDSPDKFPLKWMISQLRRTLSGDVMQFFLETVTDGVPSKNFNVQLNMAEEGWIVTRFDEQLYVSTQ